MRTNQSSIGRSRRRLAPSSGVAIFAILASAAVLTGCNVPSVSREMQRVKVQEGFGRRYTGDVTEEFYVAPRDVVRLQSLNYEELNLTQQVGPDGRITVPLVGDVRVAGLTPRQIETELGAYLGKYMKKVDIVALVDLRASKRVFFVTREGGRTLPFTGDLTAFDVLVSSRVPQFSALSKIRVIRADPEDPIVLRFDFDDMRFTGDSTTNVQLREDDIIYVPLTPVGEAFYYLDLALTPFKLIGSAFSVIFRGLLIPAQFQGLDEISERIQNGQIRNVQGAGGGTIFF